MRKQSIHKWAVLVAILVLPFFIYYVWVYNIREVFFETLDYVGPKTLNEEGEEQAYSIPEFDNFHNQYEQGVDRSVFDGRITVVNFFFTTCPSICGPMNFHLYDRIYKRFKLMEDFQMVSFTVDPEKDSAAVLLQYAKDLGVKQSPEEDIVWQFIRGERDTTYALAQAFFLSAMEDETAPGGFLHSEMLVLVDWEGKIRSRRDDMGNLKGVYNSLELGELKELKEDISVLKAEYEKEKARQAYREEQAKKNERNEK